MRALLFSLGCLLLAAAAAGEPTAAANNKGKGKGAFLHRPSRPALLAPSSNPAGGVKIRAQSKGPRLLVGSQRPSALRSHVGSSSKPVQGLESPLQRPRILRHFASGHEAARATTSAGAHSGGSRGCGGGAGGGGCPYEPDPDVRSGGSDIDSIPDDGPDGPSRGSGGSSWGETYETGGWGSSEP